MRRWRKIHGKYGINGLLKEHRGVGSSGRPCIKELTTEEKLAKLERKNTILKEQVHFLKKTPWLGVKDLVQNFEFIELLLAGAFIK